MRFSCNLVDARFDNHLRVDNHARPSRDQLARQGLALVQREAKRAWLRSGQRADLDELISVGHAVLARAVDDFQPARARFAAYLIQRVRWALLDALRRRARRGRLRDLAASASTGGEGRAAGAAPSLLPSPSQPRTPEQVIVQRRRRRRLRHALGQLPEPDRTLVMGHYFEGRRFQELAGELGMSRSIASRRHRRAVRSLARMMSSPSAEHAATTTS
jgi:RNA polymerase sigma factor for flagellar operon FliA